MTELHGSDTVVLFNGTDISAFTKSTDDTDTREAHDTTVYGMDRKRYFYGLGDGTYAAGGFYDTAVGNLEDTVKPIKEAKTIVPFVIRPEGTGSGLPQETVNVLVTSFKQSHPVDDMVTWEMELQKSGAINNTPQA